MGKGHSKSDSSKKSKMDALKQRVLEVELFELLLTGPLSHIKKCQAPLLSVCDTIICVQANYPFGLPPLPGTPLIFNRTADTTPCSSVRHARFSSV